jgi:Na+-transporting NADH:ubiquinone oxidoreductase subunit NqrC
MERNNLGTKKANIPGGMTAGFVASLISGLFIILVGALAIIPNYNYIKIQASLFTSLFGLAKDAAIIAWVIYFVMGTFIWGTLYALMQPKLSGDTQTKKGLMFGVFTWLVYMMILMPIAGEGFFALKYGIAAVIFTLVLNLIFGAVLGATYNKASDIGK